MSNPLEHFNLFNERVIEPHVATFSELNTEEPLRVNLVNELVVISAFRSGKPFIRRQHPDHASTANYHDPDRNGDQGVELCRIAKDSFSDRGVFGAGIISTIRVDPATNAFALLKASAVDVIRVERTDYGSHTNGPGITVGAGTHVGKKVTVRQATRPDLVGDDLGELISSLQYTGNGSAAALTILHATGRITYTGQPADADKVTVNGKIFEYDSNAAVTGGNIAVAIGASVDATYANLAAAIAANVNGVTVTHDAANNIVVINGPEAGVVLAETLDTGNNYAIGHLAPAARLQVALTNPTDGSQNLDIALTLSAYRTIDRLVAFINNQQGYTCRISTYADKFLPSTGLDTVSAVNVKTGPVALEGNVAAIVHWLNNSTRGRYAATELSRAEPDDQTVNFTGGTTPAVTAAHWEQALAVVSASLERGAILLPDTDDPAIFAMFAAFVEEQRSVGKLFRCWFGAQPALIQAGTQDISAYDQISAAIDHERCRMVTQRVGVFRADAGNSLVYLDPVFLAAALAGGEAGNLPHVNPLTNKRLRFAGLHPDDSYDKPVREALLSAGITVVKREEDRLVVTLAVTTSRDPDRRMARIVSEIDVVDLIDAAIREECLDLRGQWASPMINGIVRGKVQRVLQRFTDEGALVKGKSAEGEPIPAYRFPDPPFVIEAGSVRIKYQGYIGSEINHVDGHGRMTYARIVGEISGGLQDLSTPVPL